ncbi:MAG: hypothetical protein IPM61_00430 [Chlorobi bacterium]|nr:hypothetical protein [Chlorobiota bacterium]MBX7215532.1 hypothetical protein [Candidatus Kapabacteria bacterium]
MASVSKTGTAVRRRIWCIVDEQEREHGNWREPAKIREEGSDGLQHYFAAAMRNHAPLAKPQTPQNLAFRSPAKKICIHKIFAFKNGIARCMFMPFVKTAL